MRFLAAIASISIAAAGTSHATVNLFYDIHNPVAAQQAWMSVAGAFTTIDFTGFAPGSNITTQYQSQGITSTDGTDRFHATASFITDGRGLYGVFNESTAVFAQPTTALGIDHPGTVSIELYSQGNLIYSSGIIFSKGVGGFVGVISDQPFDTAILRDPLVDLFIDNLYFGPPIPAPGALTVLTAAILCGRRRRSR